MSADPPVGAEIAEVRDHWWWRPGWKPGRHFYACHLTFEGAHELHGLVRKYQDALSAFSNLDMIPRQWLHLTMQGIGFVDEVPRDELREIRNAVAGRLALLRPPVVSFEHAVVLPEAVYMPAEPAEPLVGLYNAIGDAIGDVVGEDRRHRLPEQAAGYRPHVSVAYVNKGGPAQPIRDAVRSVEAAPVAVTVAEVPILTFNRDERMYVWTDRDPIPVGDSRGM